MASLEGSYVLATFEGGGSVAPFITLARKLLANGHKVRVVSDECNRDEALAAGADFSPWARGPSRPTRDRNDCPVRDWEAAREGPDGVLKFLDLQVLGPAQHHARDLIEILREHPADLVVASELVFGAMMGCEAIGQPFVAMTCNPLIFPLIDGIPPLGPGLPPAVMDEDKVLEAQIKAATMAMLDARLPDYNAQRAGFGLPPLAHLCDQLYAARQVIIATSRAFDFAPETIPDFFTYVGPQLGDNLWSKPWVSPFAADDERPLVLVSFSTTFQDQAGQLQAVVDALKRLDVRAVVTLGGGLRPDEVKGALNVHVVESAPHALLLADASLVINHGGHGTVIKAAMAGLPQLIIPHGRDQADNGVRIAYRSAGIMLPRGSDSSAIRCAAEKLLGERGYTQAAAALADRIFESYDPDAITREVERVAATSFRNERAKVA
jgi:MGT family glycosyltransferase